MSWLANLLSSSGRSNADRSQDGPRRAADTITLAKLESVHSILEVEPGKGWFTGILLELIDPTGTLIVQQPAALDPFFGKDARKRLVRSKLPNARYSSESWEELDAPDASVDRVVWLQGPHELWFEPQPGMTFGRPDKVFAEIARVLKPSGRFLLIDNMAPENVDQHTSGALHRSVPGALSELAKNAGLTLIHEDPDWITNSVDPLDVPTYDPKVHLKTHQFAQLYSK